MLEHRQLVLVVTEVVEQARDEPRGDRGVRDRDRSRDGPSQFVARQAWHEVLPAVQRFREPGNSMHSPMKSDRIVMTT